MTPNSGASTPELRCRDPSIAHLTTIHACFGPSSQSDEALAERVGEGDIEAFATLYDRYDRYDRFTFG